MFRIYLILFFMSSAALSAGDGANEENASQTHKSALRTGKKPKQSVTWQEGVRPPCEFSPFKKGKFRTQGDYDQFVEWDENGNTPKYLVRFRKDCRPGKCPKKCKSHSAYAEKHDVKNHETSYIAGFELEKPSLIIDMEWAYAFHAMERILGLTDETFDRHPSASKVTNRAQFQILLQTVSRFLDFEDTIDPTVMAQNLTVCKQATLIWYFHSVYTKICVRDGL